MVAYKITLEPDSNETFLVACPDLPGVNTFGDTREDAAHHAVDAIETWIASLIGDGLAVPRPKAPGKLKANEMMVMLPPLAAMKIELYWALQKSGITRAELMRRLKWNRESIDRLFRLDHRSRFDQLEQAFAALDRRVDVRILEMV
ncbi:MAG: type II toxin-antitoxin system HicB family antitoxin [Pseudolabrys sp.]